MTPKAYRHRYTLREMIETYGLGLGAFPVFVANRRSGRVPAQFVERVQLAVTEVNGCAACSYAHTRMALKMGIDAGEVAALLSGDEDIVRPEEAKAIAFGQHYADQQGRPERGAFDVLAQSYGDATPILVAAVQVMMVGNVSGLPLSALLSRLRGQPYQNSALGYELFGTLSPLLLLPWALGFWLARGRKLDQHIHFGVPKSGWLVPR